MPRAASIPVGLLTLISLALTIVLFSKAENPQDRNILLGILLAEGVFISWLIWSFSQGEATEELPAIPVPRNRQQDVIGGGQNNPLITRPPYRHLPLQPTRPPSRLSEPLPLPPPLPRRQVTLPSVPELSPPLPGRSNTRPAEPTPRPPTPRPIRQAIRLDDLLPSGSLPTPPPPPIPKPRPATPPPLNRPKCPKKYQGFDADSSDLPAKIALSELKLCTDILALGYACAASDGPVTSEEDDHLHGWLWCVIEKTADKDSSTFLQALGESTVQAKSRGKLRLEAIVVLAESIRSTGERKLTQAAAELCAEIVSSDGRLEPGEFASLAAAIKGLGTRSVKAADIAEELLSNDDEITEMKDELEIDDDTPKEERERKLSVAWSRENARMQAVTDAAKRDRMRHRMTLIQKIRDIYRELDDHS